VTMTRIVNWAGFWDADAALSCRQTTPQKAAAPVRRGD
jgi:hypothetical protein